MIIEDTIPTVETSLNEGDPSIIDFLPNEGETEYKFQNEGASNLQLPKTNQRGGGEINRYLNRIKILVHIYIKPIDLSTAGEEASEL